MTSPGTAYRDRVGVVWTVFEVGRTDGRDYVGIRSSTGMRREVHPDTLRRWYAPADGSPTTGPLEFIDLDLPGETETPAD